MFFFIFVVQDVFRARMLERGAPASEVSAAIVHATSRCVSYHSTQSQSHA